MCSSGWGIKTATACIPPFGYNETTCSLVRSGYKIIKNLQREQISHKLSKHLIVE